MFQVLRHIWKPYGLALVFKLIGLFFITKDWVTKIQETHLRILIRNKIIMCLDCSDYSGQMCPNQDLHDRCLRRKQLPNLGQSLAKDLHGKKHKF